MENTEFYEVLLPVALLLVISKVLMKLCKKMRLPEVIGMLLAGMLVGLIKYIPDQSVLTDTSMIGLDFFAKIGVILVMFSAGLETDLRQIKKVGAPAMVITAAGVVVPMGLGFLVATMFNGGFGALSDNSVLIQNLFFGTILTATSVSVTVATLKESGKLNTKAGTTIVAAAIIDDVVGMVVLSIVLAMSGDKQSTTSPVIVIVKTIAYFIVVAILAFAARKIFSIIEKRYQHHRLVPIFGISFCFIIAYFSERYFGIADITGAYIVGIILSSSPDTKYIDRKIDVLSYMIFEQIGRAHV